MLHLSYKMNHQVLLLGPYNAIKYLVNRQVLVDQRLDQPRLHILEVVFVFLFFDPMDEIHLSLLLLLEILIQHPQIFIILSQLAVKHADFLLEYLELTLIFLFLLQEGQNLHVHLRLLDDHAIFQFLFEALDFCVADRLILSLIKQVLGQNGDLRPEGVELVLDPIFAAYYDIEADSLLILILQFDLFTFLNFSVD